MANVASSTYDTISASSRYVQQRIASGAIRGASFGVDAAQRVYSRAPSVGSTMRVRYHLARADVDVDALDAAQQRRLGELASAADPAAAKALRRMDEDALKDLTRLDVGADTRRGLAPKYADLDATERDQLSSLVDGNPQAASNAAEIDTSGVRAALDYACNSPCSKQTDFSSPMWWVDSDVQRSLESRLDASQYARLVDSGVEPNAVAAVDDLDTIQTITRTDTDLTIDGEQHGIDVRLKFPDDDEAFYTSNSDESFSYYSDKNPVQIGEGPAEDDIAPSLIGQRDGWDVIYGQEKSGNDQGIDIIAKNPDGEYVVTEVKFTTTSGTDAGRIGKAKLSVSERTDNDGNTYGQMMDGWVDLSVDEDIAPEDLSVASPLAEYNDLQSALTSPNNGDYVKEGFVVQDEITPGSITNRLDDEGLEYDRVTIIRTDGVTQ